MMDEEKHVIVEMMGDGLNNGWMNKALVDQMSWQTDDGLMNKQDYLLLDGQTDRKRDGQTNTSNYLVDGWMIREWMNEQTQVMVEQIGKKRQNRWMNSARIMTTSNH